MSTALSFAYAAPSGVSLFALSQEQNQFTSKGSVGLAIVGSAKTHQYQLLAYLENRVPICTATISAGDAFRYHTSQGASYGSFTCDGRGVWSVSFRSEAEATEFTAQVGLTYWACQGKPPNNVVTYDVTEGSGPGAAMGDQVAIRYTAWTVKDNDRGLSHVAEVCESVRDRLKLQIGQGALNEGLEAGLVGLKRLGKRVVVVPPSRSATPPQACVYLVELCKIKLPKATVAAPAAATFGKDIDEMSESSLESAMAMSDSAKKDVLKRLTAKGCHPIFPALDSASKPTSSAAQSFSSRPSFSPPPPHPQPPPPLARDLQDTPLHELTFEEFFRLKQQQAARPVAAITMTPQAPPAPQPPLAIVPPAPAPPDPTTTLLHQQVQQLQQIVMAQQHLQSLAPMAPPVSPCSAAPAPTTDQAVAALAAQQRQLQASVDTVLERMGALVTRFDHLESHRIFKDSGSTPMSAIALTSSITRIVGENEQLKGDLADRDLKIVGLKDKLAEARKKSEACMKEAQQTLEEKKVALDQATETRLEQEREIGRLREQVGRANSERDDSARHLLTVKRLLELSDDELQKCKAKLDALDTSSAADHDRVQELQATLREERGARKAAQDRVAQLRDELQEEQGAHLRTQQMAEDRRRKMDSDRDRMQQQHDEERSATAAEVDRLRQELIDAVGEWEKRGSVDKQRYLEEGVRRGQQEGLEEGRRSAEEAQRANVETLSSKLAIQRAETDAVKATLAVLQESLESTQAALLEAKQALHRSESNGLKRDSEISQLIAGTHARIKSIMSTVYFRMDRRLRRLKQKQLKPKEMLALLMGSIKEVTLQMIAGQLDHEDDDEEDTDTASEDSPRPPVKMVQVLEPIFSSRDSDYDAMSQGGFSLGDCMSVDVEVASSVAEGFSVCDADVMEAEEPPIQEMAAPTTPVPRFREAPSEVEVEPSETVPSISGASVAFSQGPSELEVEPSETAPSYMSSEVDPRRISIDNESVETDPALHLHKGKTLFEDSSSEDDVIRSAVPNGFQNGPVSRRPVHPRLSSKAAAQPSRLAAPTASSSTAAAQAQPHTTPPAAEGTEQGEPPLAVASLAALPHISEDLALADPPPPVAPPAEDTRTDAAPEPSGEADARNAAELTAPAPASDAPAVPPDVIPEGRKTEELSESQDTGLTASPGLLELAAPPVAESTAVPATSEPAVQPDAPPPVPVPSVSLFADSDDDTDLAPAVPPPSSTPVPPQAAALQLFKDSDEESSPPPPLSGPVSAPTAPTAQPAQLFADDGMSDDGFPPPPGVAASPPPPARPVPLFPDSDDDTAGGGF